MSLFGSLDISGTGIGAAQTWLNTTAGNIANMDDVTSTDKPAYGEQTPVFVPDSSCRTGRRRCHRRRHRGGRHHRDRRVRPEQPAGRRPGRGPRPRCADSVHRWWT